MVNTRSRLIMQRFVRDRECDVQCLAKLRQLSEHLCTESFMGVENDEVSMWKGKLGKTAQYWINYIDAVWIILIFLKAVKENDVDLYIACLHSMCPAMLTSDQFHYA